MLSAHSAIALGLKKPIDEEDTTVVVISHDCDLAVDNLDVEPKVKVIIGRLVAVPNGNFTWAKAPRTLHLPMVRDGGGVTIKLVSTNKLLIAKNKLASLEPDSAFLLDGRGLGVLRCWLSARYNRSAFSNAFVDRMQTTKLDAKLAKILEPHGGLISFVNFDIDIDIDDGVVVDRPAGDPYSPSIVLVYAPGDDSEASADAAEKVVAAVVKICEERLNSGADIVLKRCIAISEGDMPISQSRVLMQWRLEHMTKKAEGHLGSP